MKEFVLFVIRHLVNDPAAVEVKERRGDTASVIELNVAKEDLGRVIGKTGPRRPPPSPGLAQGAQPAR